MNQTFRVHVESLHPSFERLMSMCPVNAAALPNTVPESGVYLFSEHDQHLYVGRTDKMRTRLKEQCRPGSPHNKAAFAFNLARKATGQTTASYQARGSRAELEGDPEFSAAFAAAKARVSAMQVRFVEEGDPVRQSLLEMYVAITLRTPHNSFGNH